MELSKYEAFLKTVELGNITQAADVLGYTQPAVSRVIADLEREWGVPLLIRNRTGVSLTPEGEYLIPQIRAVCAAQRELEGSVERLLSLDGGTVRVGSFHSVAANWLPQIVRSFLQIYPNVDIQISYNLEYSAIENSIIQGGVDCGFVTLPLNVRSTPPLHTFFLKREQLCAVLPPDHLLARAKSYPVTRFSEDPFIPIREDQDRDMSRIFKSCGVRPNIRYFAEDSNIIASMDRMRTGCRNHERTDPEPDALSHRPHALGSSPIPGYCSGGSLQWYSVTSSLPFSGACSELGCRTHIIPRVFVLK